MRIPDDVRTILTQPTFVHVATIDPDGSPQMSVVWIDVDEDLIRFSTAEGRAKPRNLRRDPRLTLSFSPPDNPYRSIVIRGRAIAIDNNGTGLIDRLAHKYTGADSYQWSSPGEVRVDITIAVDRITG